MSQKTLGILKPDLVRRHDADKVFQDIEAKLSHLKGFKILAKEKIQLLDKQAAEFYIEHAERPFYQAMIGFMTNGECIMFVMEGEDVINQYREAIGATNPKDAAEGTLRNKYGLSIDENSFHGSDSENSSHREINLFNKFTQKN